MNIYQKLIEVQGALKVPKGSWNSFGNYKYRSCEDILELVKPILKANNLLLILSDEVEERGAKNYIKAVATIINADEPGEKISNTAYAREADTKKGMDDSQITGTASSYARKYALNGLFAIDDTKDADTNEYQQTQKNAQQQTQPRPQQQTKKERPEMAELVAFINAKKIPVVEVTNTITEMFKKNNSAELDGAQLKALLVALRERYGSK